MSQPVEPSAYPLVATSRASVMAQRAAVHAGVHSLLGGEVPSLCLRLPVEPIVIYVRPIGDISTQIADDSRIGARYALCHEGEAEQAERDRRGQGSAASACLQERIDFDEPDRRDR